MELAGLCAEVVEPPASIAHPFTVVLFHGFGAPGDDLVGLAPYLRTPARYVFPAAPIELGGLYGDARAWWRLDLMRLEEDLRRGVPRDRRDEIPDGLLDARHQVITFLDALQERHGIADDHLILGGFSQGAMLALDVSLHRAAPAGLVLMSGTLLAESTWVPRMRALAGVPVMLSHGREDPLLPFDTAEVLREHLASAGAVVDWQPFRGAHSIPPPVLAAADRLIGKLAG